MSTHGMTAKRTVLVAVFILIDGVVTLSLGS